MEGENAMRFLYKHKFLHIEKKPQSLENRRRVIHCTKLIHFDRFQTLRLDFPLQKYLFLNITEKTVK